MPELNMGALCLKLAIDNVPKDTTVRLYLNGVEYKRTHTYVLHTIWFEIPSVFEGEIKITLVNPLYIGKTFRLTREDFKNGTKDIYVNMKSVQDIVSWTDKSLGSPSTNH